MRVEVQKHYIAPDDGTGHEWQQEYVVAERNGREISTRSLGRRVCTKCGRDPLEVLDVGHRLKECAA